MRILVASSPGVGHLLPLLPVARAARERGHEVRIAVGAGLAPIVAAAGFPHDIVGPATLEEAQRGIQALADPQLVGRERAAVFVRQVFSGVIATRMVDDALAVADAWRPDLIIHEDLALGMGIVADLLSIPHTTIQATAWRPRIRDLMVEPLNALRVRHGLGVDPDLGGLYGSVYFTTRPRSLRDPDAPLPTDSAELRPIADDEVVEAGDPDGTGWADPFDPADLRPRVVVTLGTVNMGQAVVLRAMVDGALAQGAQVVVALGADPATFGPPPVGVRVLAYAPMSRLLPGADLVVFHGGSGTMLAAAAAGTPMVIVPLAADQLDNADRCRAAGVADVVERSAVSADAVTAAVGRVLAEPSFRQRASAIGGEVAIMPGPDTAVIRLESIVATG